MCGIIGYIGNKDALDLLINGLKSLEYRGYDSAGIALLGEKISVFKQKGKVSVLEDRIDKATAKGTIGMGHTRWATHGEPSIENSHPHQSNNGEIVLVHNGIIENYQFLKKELSNKDFTFSGQTDTEVLVNYIQYVQDRDNLNIEEAVRKSFRDVTGSYAVVVLDKKYPNEMVVIRKGSPLVIGLTTSNEEFYICSDPIPIVQHTSLMVYLNDEELALLERGKDMKLTDLHGVKKTVKIENTLSNSDRDSVSKGNYEHYMLKEIFDQPQAIESTLKAHLEGMNIHFEDLDILRDRLMNVRRIIIISCGTSWHAGLIGEYIIEELARIPVEVEYASEFRYRNPIINKDDIVMSISQSGETADTLAALHYSTSKGATTFSICNVINSSIPRASDFTIYTHAGREVGVASTKSFTSQIALISLLAIQLGLERTKISRSEANGLIEEIKKLPIVVNEIFSLEREIKKVAKDYMKTKSFLFLARGINFPIALEGALKLKEISYIHAEGYAAGEMKHGPIAMIEKSFPTFIIGTNQKHYEKLVSNAQEIKSRKGSIIALVNQDDKELVQIADHVFKVPRVIELLQPIVSVVPLQIFAYYVSVLKGCNVDQPRNLAKSVTVE